MQSHTTQLPKIENVSLLGKKDLLRFIICGSVDDGKSTLIGRIFFELRLIHEDQMNHLLTDSRKFGTQNKNLDLSLLSDGLIAEREQGITLDVAYLYFSTEHRKFIVIDSPGHEQYTRNMITGASQVDLAVIIVDAQKGILSQTRRHSYIIHMLGIKHIVLAINKMDIVNYENNIYEVIKNDYCAFFKNFDNKTVLHVIPISALEGENILIPSPKMPWYQGLGLIQYLEKIQISPVDDLQPFRMPIQCVNRAANNFRGYTGRISSGQVKPGDEILILPGNQKAKVARIINYKHDLDKAFAGQSIALTLDKEIDVSRGNLLVDAAHPCEVAKQFNIELIWLATNPMVSGRQYIFKSHSFSTLCTLGKPRYQIDINSMMHLASDQLEINDIGNCDLFLESPFPFEIYTKNKELGAFILIDKQNFSTIGAGLIRSPLKQLTQNVFLIEKKHRMSIKNHRTAVVWFTGLSGAGKSTIANLLEFKLNSLGKHTIILDGDNLRLDLNRDLDFTPSGRTENIRRIAEVAKLMTDAGLITLVSCISPFQIDRDAARAKIGSEQFLEIYIEVPLYVAESRDKKNLYRKARASLLKNFTGIDSPYEIPLNPELHIDSTVVSPSDAADLIIDLLNTRKILNL